MEDRVPRSAGMTPRIIVAILTYSRTDKLAAVLPRLRGACAGVPGATVLVVDNNPTAEAATVVHAQASVGRGGSLLYVHEPTPGIAAARNRALAEAASSEVLVFIDDDERPAHRWLELLLDLYERSKPAAIAGPVISEFESTPEPWITAGRFFTRRRMPTGITVSVAATNNLLLDVKQVNELGLRFDDRFGLSGGSDTLFTRELVRRGGNIVWCDEAVVVDQVPAARLSRKWVLQKAFRLGNVLVRIDLAMAQSRPQRIFVRVRRGFGGIARISFGAARAVFGFATRNLSHESRGIRLSTRGSGILLGAIGYAYSEYAREDSTHKRRHIFASDRTGVR